MSGQESSKEAARQWLLKSHRLYDSLNVEGGLGDLYTPNAVLCYAGGEEMVGKDNIKAFFTTQFPSLRTMRHTLRHHDIVSNRIYQQTDITYTFPEVNGQVKSSFTVKAMAVSVFEKEGGWDVGGDGKMVRFEVYLDASGFGRE